MIWLKSPSDIDDILPGSTMAEEATSWARRRSLQAHAQNPLDDPAVDERVPDIIVKVKTGVIFTGGSKIAEHGGLNEDDIHVGLLVSGPGISSAEVVKANVSTAQVAPASCGCSALTQPTAGCSEGRNADSALPACATALLRVKTSAPEKVRRPQKSRAPQFRVSDKCQCLCRA